MTKQKLSVICGVGVLALIAGFGPRPASALPNALPITRLASPVFDHAGDFWRNGGLVRQDQNHRSDRDDQRRNWNRDQGNRGDQNYNQNNWNRDNRNQYQDDRNQYRDNRNHDRDDRNRDDRNRNRDDRNRDNRR